MEYLGWLFHLRPARALLGAIPRLACGLTETLSIAS